MKNIYRRIFVILMCVVLFLNNSTIEVFASEISDISVDSDDDAISEDDISDDDVNSIIDENDEDLLDEELIEETGRSLETDEGYEETEIVISEEEYTAESLNESKNNIEYEMDVNKSSGNSQSLSNPRIENGVVTWDCIWFGSYWQNDTNHDGIADENDEKQPIKWRVLSVDDESLLVVSDTILTYSRMNAHEWNVPWEQMEIRRWLNSYADDEGDFNSQSGFSYEAFSENEMSAILSLRSEPIFLLNRDDIYGFFDDNSRKSTDSMYAANIQKKLTDAEGRWGNLRYYWWINSRVGGFDNRFIKNTGELHNSSGYGLEHIMGIRPAIHLDLSQKESYQYAGTINSNNVMGYDGVPLDAFCYNGHRYTIFYSESGWENAKENCEILGGHLATVTSQDENDALFQYVKSQNLSDVFFGYTDEKTEGVWEWVSGEISTYTNWGDTQPDNVDDEDYGMFYHDEPTGRWNDGNFRNTSGYYICEWDSAPVDTRTEFNEAVYRADYLHNLDVPSSKNWDNYVNRENIKSPSIEYYNAAIAEGMDWTTKAWDSINVAMDVVDNPSKIGSSLVTKNQSMYEALLLEVFSTSSSSTASKVIAADKKHTKMLKSLAGITEDLVEEMKLETNVAFCNLPVETQLIFRNSLVDSMKDKGIIKGISESNTIIKNLDKCLGAANTISEGIEMWGQYCSVYEYMESRKNALYAMWKNCPTNSIEYVELKAALKDLYEMVSLESEQFYNKLLTKEVVAGGSYCVELLCGELWKDMELSVCASNPYVAMYVTAIKTGIMVDNMVFNTDGQVTAFHNVGAMAQLRYVAEKAYNEMYSNYEINKDEDSALNYLASVDLMYRVMHSDCTYAEKFVKSVYNTPIDFVKRMFGRLTSENELAAIEVFNNSYKNVYIGALTAWVEELAVDYPEEYEVYKQWVDDYDYVIKKYSIACPVDVFVFNSTGEQVGSITSEGVMVNDDKVTLCLAGENKIVYFSNNCNDYSIQYIGTDEGTMDIEVSELNDKGEAVRDVKFDEVPLSVGRIYTETISNTIQIEDEYKLFDMNNKIIRPNADTTDNRQLSKYSISVENGLATDIDECSSNILSYANEYVTLVATCEDGEFFEWRVISGSEDLVIDNPSCKITKLIPGNGDCVISAVTKGDYGDVLYEDFPNHDPNQIPKGLWIAGQLLSYEYSGTSIKPQVRAYDNKSLLLLGKDYTISYKNNVKAYTLSEEDEGFNPKLAPSITIKSKGNYAGSETVYFKIMPADISGDTFTADKMAIKANNKAQKPVPALLWNGKSLAAKGNYSISYYNADETGAAVGEPLVSVKDAGEYVIRLTAIGTNFVGTKDIALSVTADKILVSKLSVGKIANQTHTGSPLEPELTIKNGKNPLTEGTDYELTYSDNTNVGKACVLIEGKGNYTGVRRVYFNITGTPLSKATVTGISTVPYTGNEIEFDDISLYIKATKTIQQIDLEEGKDYTVSYSKNVNAGTGTVIFTGINGYIGTVKKTFKITAFKLANEPDRISVEMDDSIVYSKGGAKPLVTVKFTTGDGTVKTLTEKTDYTLAYSKNTAVNDCSNPKKLPTVKITLKGSYSGSISKNYSITPKDIADVRLSVNDKTYQNKKNIYASAPALTDTDGKKLAAGKDYDKTLAYTYKNETTVTNGTEEVVRGAGDAVDKNDIIPAGTTIKVTATAKASGNYNGTVSGEYRITKSSIASAKTTIPAQIYSGSPIILTKEEITLKVGKDTLTSDDFEIVEGSYKNNVKKGTASLTIKGVGNYGGTKTVNFAIKAKTFIWWWRYL